MTYTWSRRPIIGDAPAGEVRVTSSTGAQKGYEWSLSYAALMRHLTQFWGGEDRDQETGAKHVISVAWHALALAQFMEQHPDFDNRPRNTK